MKSDGCVSFDLTFPVKDGPEERDEDGAGDGPGPAGKRAEDQRYTRSSSSTSGPEIGPGLVGHLEDQK